MKKQLLSLFAILALNANGAWAQWQPSDTDYTIVGTDSIYGQSGLKTLHTPQGNTVITWTERSKGVDKSQSGYYLHLQVYDKDGKAKFQKGGIIVSNKPTMSYTTDYGLSLADNGDLVMAYFDTRNDPSKYNSQMFAYRYTQDGESVWDKEGIQLITKDTHTWIGDIGPQIVASGDYAYFGCAHNEIHMTEADSTNWQPNPWNPNEEMPDSVEVTTTTFQLQCLNLDGTFKWAEPKVFDLSTAFLYTAPESDLYFLYANAGEGLDAQRINAEGENVWGQPVNVESESLSSGMYFATPVTGSDGQGGLLLTYRKLTSYSGYIVLNRLQSDGTVYEEATNCNGSTDGDGESPKLAVKDDKVLVAWEYELNNKSLMVNQFSLDGDYTWEGDSLLGYAVMENEQWGARPVSAIPQQNGWVLLYGDCQSWNSANFYVEKIDDNGRTMWKKQIAENDFKSSGISVTYDDQYAYIFYTCDKEIDDNREEIPGPGGLRLMVVDITDSTNGIAAPTTEQTDATQAVYYNAQGMQVNDTTLPGLYLVKQGNNVKKVIVK